jgi:4-amino-4-deoxy-L-arabinose transferase-like glycosyltransferase
MSRRLAAVVAFGVLVRAPFWLEALRTPLDGDEAVTGLMALHPGIGTTFWGTAYGSPLEAWLISPLVAVFGATALPLRLYDFALGLALIPLAWALGAALHPRAALPAALVMACPSAYMLLFASLPPTVYPTSAVLCGVALLLALRAAKRLRSDAAADWLLMAWGIAAGAALWLQLSAASVVLASAAYLLWAGRQRPRALAAGVVALLFASSPLWLGWLRDARAAEMVGLTGAHLSPLAHAAHVAAGIGHPIAGLLGSHAPLIADDVGHVVWTPFPIPWLLALAYLVVASMAFRRARGSAEVALVLGALVLGILLFPFPARSGPETIRYLTPLYLPLVALVGLAAAAWGSSPRALAVALAFASLHLVCATRLLAAWRATDRAQPPFSLPDLAPVRQLLEARGVRHAYASYVPAYRLCYESHERLVVSQPWNERFPGYPLRYLDEVRSTKDAAWVLTPSIPSRLPDPDAFEAALAELRGRCRRTDVGAAIVYDDCEAPFGSAVVPWPGAGAASDGDLATRVVEPASGPTTFVLPQPTALDAISLVSPLGELRLPEAARLEVSSDGRTFERVGRRHAGEEHGAPGFVAGQLQWPADRDLISVALGGRSIVAIRVTPLGAPEPWAVGEILMHLAGAGGAWSEWIEPEGPSRGLARELEAAPRRDREDWYYRSLVASRAASASFPKR